MQYRCSKLRLLGIMLALLFSISPSLLAQEPTAEPPPPTAELPTLEPPTAEPPTAEPPTVEPPTATNTELSPPTETFAETPLPTATLTSTETPTETATAPLTSTLTPTAIITATPSLMPTPNPLAEELDMPQFGQIAPLRQDCGVALVNAGDVTGLTNAVAAANAGTVCTIYLNVDIPYNASEAQRTYYTTERLLITGAVTIHGNNAILRMTMPGRVIFIFEGAELNLHHVTVTGADLTEVQGTNGYGAGIFNNIGTLRVYDSTILGNVAINGGGGIVSNGVLVYLRRVSIRENYAGGGAGLQTDFSGRLEAECVQFWDNSGGYGVGVLSGASSNTSAQISIHYSSLYGNLTINNPNPEEDIVNLLPNNVSIQAQQNWWGADGAPAVFDGQTGASIDTSQALTFDPTVPVSGVYAISECEPVPPEPLPPICPQGVMLQNGGVTIQQEICVVPTPTPTFTPTPTPTPMPTCVVGNITISNVNVRNAPNGSAPIIGLLFPSQQVTVTGEQDGWYQFFAGDIEHWVSNQVVTPDPVNSCNDLPGPITLTESTPQNSGIYCLNALTPADALDYCRDFIYNNLRLVYNEFSARLGRSPTLREVTGMTIQLEWWDSRALDSNIEPYGTEGISRNYFQQCGTDGCNDIEILYYLSGYQPWLIGTLGLEVTVDRLEVAYNLVSGDLANPSSELSLATDTVLNPTDLAWQDGKVADEPWQWFNPNPDTSGTRPNIGIDPCNAVLLRVEISPGAIFEMYTAAQADNISSGTC